MLTERQQAILDYVRTYHRENRVAPSTREIARTFSVSQPTVIGHLQALAKKNALEKLADGKWGLSQPPASGSVFELPIHGSIPAGIPTANEQDTEETVLINPSIFGIAEKEYRNLWLLRVRGESMIGAGILDGDIVVLENREPRDGEIVAALVDGTETTLKRYQRTKSGVRLHAENSRFHDIIPTRELRSQGVVVGLIRPTIR